MNGENDDEKIELDDNEDNKFGNVIDTLHNKAKLPSLRTYQGDMAEFIKEKNESVLSIAVKEKIRKEERQEKEEKAASALSSSEPKEEKIEKAKEETKKEIKEKDKQEQDKLEQEPEPQAEFKSKTSQNGLQINLTMILLSLFLIVGGITATFYIFNLLKEGSPNKVVITKEIMPYNNILTLANVSGPNLRDQLIGLPVSNGINIIKVSDVNGVSFLKAKDFFSFLQISLPSELLRTLKDDYILGSFSQNSKNSYFMIITANDFGVAFAGMLEWEKDMIIELSFLNLDLDMASTTKNSFSWRDIIIKNKDTRALVDDKEKSQIAYTFLDKNTILIVGDLSVIGDLSSAYASRSVER